MRKIHVFDRSNMLEPHEAWLPFALEEKWCRALTLDSTPILHIWRHPRAFVMGLRDSRMPHALEAKSGLIEQGYATAVRNSGGLAVPLDTGVLNISLLKPKATHELSYEQDFEWMVDLLSQVMKQFGVNVKPGEIQGSFCPGKYDMSIAGKKFCGIAQRRLSQSISVQAFLMVEGIGQERAQIAEQFYRIASGTNWQEDPSFTQMGFPKIDKHVMASVSELIGTSISISQFLAQMWTVFEQNGVDIHFARHFMLSEHETNQQIDFMKMRYDI
jgi:octanoyl-[GcvH]:protein N-octanoyltransferase